VPENGLRHVLFTLVLRERFRRGLNEKREQIEAETWKAALRGRRDP
jgi:hypothetical protein